MNFHLWEPTHKIQGKLNNPLPLEVDWKSLFISRWNVNRETSKILNKIASTTTHRIKEFHKIGSFGYDAVEYLIGQTKASDDLEDVLSRRWYATSVLQFLHRRRAIQIIRKMSSDEDISIEEGLSIFDLFNIEVDENMPEDTAQILDELASRFRSQTPNMDTIPIKTKALALCQFMKQEGFHGATSEDYRKLQNCYIGVSLRATRMYIPLTSAAIYCSLAQRIGLSAYLCGFPYHVLAIVKQESGQNLFVDPFYDGGHGRIRGISELESEVQALGIREKQIYLCPSPIREMVLRTSRNLLESLRHGINSDLPAGGHRHSTPVSRASAVYAALMTSVLLGRQYVVDGLLEHLIAFLSEEMCMDVQFFEEDVLRVAGTSQESRELIQRKCDELREFDRHLEPPRRRSKEKKAIKYTVGTVFTHKMYGYQGIVFGWTPSCDPESGELWIKQMGVDDLSGGRYQPFYHSLADDESERYVAEENIVPIRPKANTIQGLCEVAGKRFKRYSEEDGMFIPIDTRAYPEG